MTRRSAAARVVGVAAIAVAPICLPATASAVTPPAVDAALLPSPRPPAPPVPTQQAEPCVGAGALDGDDRRLRAEQLTELDLPSVWALNRGSGQTVAVIDTGVARHRLLPRLSGGGDYVSTGDGTEDCDGHGTMVAGIIAAATDLNDVDVFGGVAPDASILSIRQSSTKFRAADPSGESGFGDVETLAMAIRTAADLGAGVINISSVACVPVADAPDDRSLGAALSYAVDVRNVVVVAAAGNVGGQCREQNPPSDSADDWDSVRTVVSPAWYDDLVLTVASVDPDGAPSRFSLSGPWVDVAAPGEEVVSLDPDGEGLIDALPGSQGPKAIAGTSYAAPVVSGIATLVRARWPHLTARQVMQRIEDTARHPAAGWNPQVGRGVVDALAAVSGGPSPTASPAARRDEHVAAVLPLPQVDDSAERFAFLGAGVCVGVATAVGLSRGGSRLRRRSAVADD